MNERSKRRDECRLLFQKCSLGSHRAELATTVRGYSCPYLNQQKPLFLPVIAYTLSTTKLEIRAK
jgi:hypothetical protein